MTTRAHRDDVAGEREGVLALRVRAAPVDGKANAAVCKLLAKRAGVAAGSVSVVRGHGAREKVVRIEGIDEASLRKRLGIG